MCLLVVYHTEYLCDTATPEPRGPTEQQARSFTLGKNTISSSSRPRKFHVSHFSRIENPKSLSQVLLQMVTNHMKLAFFSVGTNYILEQIAIIPQQWLCGPCLADFPSLHLGVNKEILSPGIKNNDSMKVALDGCSCFFRLSPKFSVFLHNAQNNL